MKSTAVFSSMILGAAIPLIFGTACDKKNVKSEESSTVAASPATEVAEIFRRIGVLNDADMFQHLAELVKLIKTSKNQPEVLFSVSQAFANNIHNENITVALGYLSQSVDDGFTDIVLFFSQPHRTQTHADIATFFQQLAGKQLKNYEKQLLETLMGKITEAAPGSVVREDYVKYWLHYYLTSTHENDLIDALLASKLPDVQGLSLVDIVVATKFSAGGKKYIEEKIAKFVNARSRAEAEEIAKFAGLNTVVIGAFRQIIE